MENQFLDGYFVEREVTKNFNEFHHQQVNEQRRTVAGLISWKYQCTLHQKSKEFVLTISTEQLNGIPLFDEVLKELKDVHWEVEQTFPNGAYTITPATPTPIQE